MVTRRASVLGKRLTPETSNRRSSEAGAGTHSLGLGEQIRTKNQRGVQTHCGSTANQLASSRSKVQVRNAQLTTILEQVAGPWGFSGYVIWVLCTWGS